MKAESLLQGVQLLTNELRAGCSRLDQLSIEHRQQLDNAEARLDDAETCEEYLAAWQRINDVLTEQGEALDLAAGWADGHNERTTGAYYHAKAS